MAKWTIKTDDGSKNTVEAESFSGGDLWINFFGRDEKSVGIFPSSRVVYVVRS